MGRIKGITVILISKEQTGTDPFGAPVYEETRIPVDNVLVAPAERSEDVSSQEQPFGYKGIYTIAIPKGDTHKWQDNLVEFFGRTWKVTGFPAMGIEENIPLAWNQKWTVELYG